MTNISLVQATENDLPLLYSITQQAMSEVNKKINGDRKYSEEERKIHYDKYVSEFSPKLSSTMLISLNNQFVGRLRVDENADTLHIGGIQIIPEFQNKGIGGHIISTLIDRSNQTHKPVTLLVHKVNQKAIGFYTSRGFRIVSETESQYKMQYSPA